MCTSRAWRNVARRRVSRSSACAGARSTPPTSRASASTRSSPRAPATWSGSTSRTAPFPARPTRRSSLDAARALDLRHDAGAADLRLGAHAGRPARRRTRSAACPASTSAGLRDHIAASSRSSSSSSSRSSACSASVGAAARRRVQARASARRSPSCATADALPPRTVAAWQAGDWALRFVAIWFFLGAFGIDQSIRNVLLVQVTQSLATLVPITPGGIGTEQAFIVYVFARRRSRPRGSCSRSASG